MGAAMKEFFHDKSPGAKLSLLSVLVGAVLLVVLVLILKPDEQRQEETMDDSPLSTYDALTKECEIDKDGYGTCDYYVDYNLDFTIWWDKKLGRWIDPTNAGNQDESFYIDFDNIEMTLVPVGKKGDFGYEFHFTTNCIPILAGKGKREEYRKYQEKYSGGLIGYRAYVSPITGMIYEEMLECHNDIPAQ